MLTRAFRAIAGLPRTMRLGLFVAAVGAAIDLGHHFTADAEALGHGAVAMSGHVVSLAGMVITMVGLVGAAIRANATPIATTKGEPR
jgi:hypothetical protein